MTMGGLLPSEGTSAPESPLPPPCTAMVVTYQSADHIGPLLDALRQERDLGVDLEVVVVDNASTDATLTIVSGRPGVRLIASDRNVGYAAGVNVGSREVPVERALLVLNPDVVPSRGAVASLLYALADPGVGVVVPRVLNTDGTVCPSLRNEPSIGRAVVDTLFGARAAYLPSRWSGMVWDPRAYDEEQSTDWALGAAVLVSPQCRALVGDWDERYFLYSEETDYLRRVRAAGLQVRYRPTALVRHIGGGSGRSDALYALCAVNAVRYFRQNHAAFPSGVFTVLAVVRELARSRRPAARLALRALLSRRTRSTLPGPSGRRGGEEHA